MDSASLTLDTAVESSILQIGDRHSVPHVGLLSGQKVITTAGQIPVEAVESGTRLLTFDGGYQPVTDVRRERLPLGASVMVVPKGVFGNQGEILMLPEQDVIFDLDMSAEAFVDPFAMIRASDLSGHWGIKPRVVLEPLLSTQILFAQDEVLRTSVAAMFHCPQAVGAEVMLDQRQAA
ncbi:Hint domain-containing protein [Cognatiyoonia sediminum]|uniref:Hint domain-containing protein n=1 Tax=Cognatiyoonia sediminum TaxID=1508389 RepID=A0A1M5SJ83_9RHOB|nr:Hint domain-containing protein [Cognatiyoonia sediminum]SHH38652.1 Hint domain-containing protein [Cognatiyoonia sediminum]